MSRMLLLAGTVVAVTVPIFIGHGIAAHRSGAILLGIGMGVVAAVLVGLHIRAVPPDVDA